MTIDKCRGQKTRVNYECRVKSAKFRGQRGEEAQGEGYGAIERMKACTV